jgi:opacity protein-like surface antigen
MKNLLAILAVIVLMSLSANAHVWVDNTTATNLTSTQDFTVGVDLPPLSVAPNTTDALVKLSGDANPGSSVSGLEMAFDITGSIGYKVDYNFTQGGWLPAITTGSVAWHGTFSLATHTTDALPLAGTTTVYCGPYTVDIGNGTPHQDYTNTITCHVAYNSAF